LSATQAAAAEQTWVLASHSRLQQSVAALHGVPAPPQVVMFETQ
jgi:hypothetical protein